MDSEADTLRIGQIEYANCFPLFDCLKNTFPASNYVYLKGVPSELNSMLSSGQLDICPSSSIEYARAPDKYLIIKDLSISSIGPVKSVFLFSRKPIENLDGNIIGVSGESATSVNLLKIVLASFYGFKNQYVKIEKASINSLHDYPAVLLIGDTALSAGLLENEDVYAYDLGDAWFKNTGLPFVFALWIIREDFVRKNKKKAISLYTKLCKAKMLAYNSFGNCADNFGQHWIDKEDLISYWKIISYDLNPEHLEGLLLYYRLSADLGLIGKVPGIRLFPEE